jgi:Xaa-Pro aminopeptidase
MPGVKGGGGVRIEDTIIVTETGNEIISPQPYCDELLG